MVGSWLLDLTADVLRSDREPEIRWGVSDSGEGRWTVHALWILAYPPLSSLVRCGHVLSRAVLDKLASKVLNGMRAMFGGHDVRRCPSLGSNTFVLSTVYFGIRKGENNYYESDKYDGNGMYPLIQRLQASLFSVQLETYVREN